nr:MAG TPA: hypothetical protein [Bacteriophage sp.]
MFLRFENNIFRQSRAIDNNICSLFLNNKINVCEVILCL